MLTVNRFITILYTRTIDPPMGTFSLANAEYLVKTYQNPRAVSEISFQCRSPRRVHEPSAKSDCHRIATDENVQSG